MTARILLVLILFCTACMSGRIPCPDARGPRTKKVKNYKLPEFMASAASKKELAEMKNQGYPGKDQDSKFVKNVSVEEWDCPHPGEKKYMPRSVKENIRKNMKRIKSAEKAESDSTGVK